MLAPYLLDQYQNLLPGNNYLHPNYAQADLVDVRPAVIPQVSGLCVNLSKAHVSLITLPGIAIRGESVLLRV